MLKNDLTNSNLSDDEKWKAVIENDERYDGVFFYCVKSTGIFCRPSCKSKVPHRNNVLFVDSRQEATNLGFRPCKRCRSDLVSYKPLRQVAVSLKTLTDEYWNDTIKYKEELREFGFSEHRLAEIFKEEYGVTPNEYLAGKRLEYAKGKLLSSDIRIIDLSADLGFSSLSSFYKFFKERTGVTPAAYRKENRTI